MFELLDIVTSHDQWWGNNESLTRLQRDIHGGCKPPWATTHLAAMKSEKKSTKNILPLSQLHHLPAPSSCLKLCWRATCASTNSVWISSLWSNWDDPPGRPMYTYLARFNLLPSSCHLVLLGGRRTDIFMDSSPIDVTGSAFGVTPMRHAHPT